MRPHLGHVENVPTVLFRFARVHDLDVDVPLRKISSSNSIEHVLDQMVGVLAGDSLSCLAVKVFHANGCLDVDLDILERAILQVTVNINVTNSRQVLASFVNL